jgi:hypothetical protein
MAKQSVHNKILKSAAREVLAPLGLQQEGRSRGWHDDGGWYVIGVEFQPSNWTKGSYLNIAAQWLWYPRDFFCMDLGGREIGFIEFEDETQFRSASVELAQLAAKRVLELRGKVATLAGAYATLSAHCATPPQPPEQLPDRSDPEKLAAVYEALAADWEERRKRPGQWRDLHLWVLAGLVGKVDEGKSLASHAKVPAPRQEFDRERNRYIEALLEVIEDPEALRAWLEEKIAECRALLKLEACKPPVLPAS